MPMHFSAKCLWSFLCVFLVFVLLDFYALPTHIGSRFVLYQLEITVRMFQVLNYYREIILCVVTCCVYNYLFLLHGNDEEKAATPSTAWKTRVSFLFLCSMHGILNWDCYVLTICQLSLFSYCITHSKWSKTRKSDCNLNISSVKSFPNINFNFMVNFQFSAVFQNPSEKNNEKLLHKIILKC